MSTAQKLTWVWLVFCALIGGGAFGSGLTLHVIGRSQIAAMCINPTNMEYSR